MGGVATARVGSRVEELPLRSAGLDSRSESLAGYTVSQLGAEIQDLVREAWSSVWVVGEVSRHRESAAGHHYFDLVEKGEGDRIVGTLSAVIWRGEWARIRGVLERSASELGEGVALRCRIGLDFYPPGGRLQAQVREIDPEFTLGELERRRRETIAELEAGGLVERNRRLPFPDLPLRLGLVTSEGSAAYHDFLSTLRESGFGFKILFVHSSVQGRDAEREVVSALELLGSREELDALVLVRGGGSRTDLAAFDSRAVAEAVARSPKPVLTGLGHEIDFAVADLVAHRASKTPTGVAELLVETLERAERSVERLRSGLLAAARLPLGFARERLLEADRAATAARARLERAGAHLAALESGLARSARRALRSGAARILELGGRFGRSGPRALDRFEQVRAVAGWRLVGAARSRLAGETERLEGRRRLVAELGPGRTLARGFSITRTEAGRVVRSPADAPAGTELRTETSGGSLRSRVEER